MSLAADLTAIELKENSGPQFCIDLLGLVPLLTIPSLQNGNRYAHKRMDYYQIRVNGQGRKPLKAKKDRTSHNVTRQNRCSYP